MKSKGGFFVLFIFGSVPIVLSSVDPQNVFGSPLESCSTNPLTGWYRDGFCQTDDLDQGTHTICAKMTQEVNLYFFGITHSAIFTTFFQCSS